MRQIVSLMLIEEFPATKSLVTLGTLRLASLIELPPGFTATLKKIGIL